MDDRQKPYSMWADAVALLDRADRLHRQFFEVSSVRRAGWEPPVDVFETDHALWVVVALPGVNGDQVELAIRGGDLVVAGVRTLPRELRGAVIHRLELPAGRFERRIELPPGHYELVERRFGEGCLSLGLRKR